MSQSYILTLYDNQMPCAGGQWRAIHDRLWDTGKFEYIGSQLEECPVTKRLHWQAFVKFHKQMKQRGSFFKKLIHNSIHFETVSIERAEAIGYGIKEESRVEGPLENGEKPKASDKAGKGGQKNKERYELAYKQAKEGNFEEMDKEILMKMYSTVKKIHYEHKEKVYTQFQFFFRPWQKEIYTMIMDTQHYDDRSIIWIEDSQGGSGKTKFGKWIGSLPKSIYITLEKKENILYMVNEETTIIVDYARSEGDMVNYATLEKLKDGAWTCGKYEGKQVCRKEDCILIVFSNSPPVIKALSRDRWRYFIIDLNHELKRVVV